MDGGRHYSTGRNRNTTGWETGTQVLYSPLLLHHTRLDSLQYPFCLLAILRLLFDVFLLFSLQSLEVYYVCPCMVVTIEWMKRNRLFNRGVRGLVIAALTLPMTEGLSIIRCVSVTYVCCC